MAKKANRGGEGCPCCVAKLGGKRGAKRSRNRAERREGRVSRTSFELVSAAGQSSLASREI